jgi:hypothetical protein
MLYLGVYEIPRQTHTQKVREMKPFNRQSDNTDNANEMITMFINVALWFFISFTTSIGIGALFVFLLISLNKIQYMLKEILGELRKTNEIASVAEKLNPNKDDKKF